MKLKNAPQPILIRYIISRLSFLLGVASLVVALTGPAWGTYTIKEARRGLDVAFAFDLSRSMESRLAAVKQDAGTAAKDANCRFTVVIGKGQGVSALPLTWDKEALTGLLDALSPAMLTGRGTNLENIVDSALASLKTGLPTQKRIVLFSDGEEMTGSLDDAAARAKTAGCPIVAVGVGDNAAKGPAGTGFNEALLRNAASVSGGVYIDGNSTSAGEQIRASLAGIETRDTVYTTTSRPKPRQGMFVLIAIILFLISESCKFVPLSGRHSRRAEFDSRGTLTEYSEK
jgi:Ca-activated chloride channel family protein